MNLAAGREAPQEAKTGASRDRDVSHATNTRAPRVAPEAQIPGPDLSNFQTRSDLIVVSQQQSSEAC